MNINISYDNGEYGKGYYVDFVTGRETEYGTLEAYCVGFSKIRVIAIIKAKFTSLKNKCGLNVCC